MTRKLRQRHGCSSHRTAELVSTQSRHAADAARTVALAGPARVAHAPPIPASAWRCGGAGHARAATATPAPISGGTRGLRRGALRLRDGKIAVPVIPAVDPGKPSRPAPGAASVVAVRRGPTVVAAPGTCPLPRGRVDGRRDGHYPCAMPTCAPSLTVKMALTPD